jgi:arylsulfatase A-like enzyme
MRRLVLLVAALVASGCQSDPFRLPERVRIEQLVADLSATFNHAAVTDELAANPVRTGAVEPGFGIELNRGARAALLAPPPATLRFHVHVPGDARLRFGMAVSGPGKRDPGASGVHFAVEVDGREVHSSTINPAATRRDRRWFDVDVPLGPTERDADIVLRTTVAGHGARVAGTPAWSHVRVVREQWRDRQTVAMGRPNVLVLLVDTLRADELGHWTRTLDALAAHGTRFTAMQSQAPWTMPSVATLLTGLHPRSHGVVGGFAHPDARGGDIDPAFLADAVVTLPELAQDAGITTVGVSANPLISRATNFTQGFETFVETGWDRDRRNWRPASTVNETFIRWLDENRAYRFLAYLHYMEPHDPYTPSDEHRPPRPAGLPAAIAAGDAEALSKRVNHGPPATLPAEQLAYLRRLYDLEVEDWDAALSRLLTGLMQAGVRDSTIIVVIGDHGEEFLEHGRLKHGMHLYEELLHVPLVIAGPGVPVGEATDPVQTIDVLPTIAELLGIPVPPGLPGQSLLGRREVRPAFAETRAGIAADGRATTLISVRAGDWKLIQSPELGISELYDLARDPGEHENRFGSAPEGAHLAALLADWQAHAPAPPPVGGRDPELGTKLRALGYVD